MTFRNGESFVVESGVTGDPARVVWWRLRPVDSDDWYGTDDHQAYEDLYAAADEGSRDDYTEPPAGTRVGPEDEI